MKAAEQYSELTDKDKHGACETRMCLVGTPNLHCAQGQVRKGFLVDIMLEVRLKR